MKWNRKVMACDKSLEYLKKGHSNIYVKNKNFKDNIQLDSVF